MYTRSLNLSTRAPAAQYRAEMIDFFPQASLLSRPFFGAPPDRVHASPTEHLLNHETDIPTRATEARPQTRIPRTDENQRWPTRYQGTTRPRPCPARGTVINSPEGGAPSSGHRFRRAQRILRGSEFIHTMRVGKRFNQGAFTVYLAASPCRHARLGIAVGRRVSLKAHERNTIKRIIRDCFRREAAALPAMDIVFNARPPAAKNTRAELAMTVRAALTRARQESAYSSTQRSSPDPA